MTIKLKKTLNISLQSKKYAEPINKIINNWEDDGLNISVKVCDTILLFDKYDKSITLSNISNIYELIEKIVGLYYKLDTPESNMEIEELLSQVITVDNSKLTKALANLNEKVSQKQNDKTNFEKTEEVIEVKEKNANLNKSKRRQSIMNNQDSEGIDNNDENYVPLDFLSNS